MSYIEKENKRILKEYLKKEIVTYKSYYNTELAWIEDEMSDLKHLLKQPSDGDFLFDYDIALENINYFIRRSKSYLRTLEKYKQLLKGV